MKKILAIVLTLIIAFVWYVSIVGIGKLGPLKDDLKLGLDISGGVYVVMEAQTDKSGSELKALMEQTQAVIEERVNEMGLSEPVVTIEGDNRIRVELPGMENSDAAIESIGKTAQLQFLAGNGIMILDGSQVNDSGVQMDEQNGGYAVTLKFNSEGADAFYEATKAAVEGTVQGNLMQGLTGLNQIAIVLDGQIISAPVPNSAISGGEAIITGGAGGFKQDEAIELSMLIRAGALPVELHEVESSSIGATLGMGALKDSLIAGAIGIALVILLMIFMYRLMGLCADLALLLYIPLLFWVLILFKGVLTLPGIAGIILSIGMAVDANVIIFARVREEVAEGKTIRVAVQTGFKRAMGTIVDSQLTTLIAGIVLYQFGTGPVRGFALTLIIGIIIGLFTATVLTNIYVRVFAESKFLINSGIFGVREYDSSKPPKQRKQFKYVKNRKIYYIAAIAIIVVGFAVGGIRGFNLGIDFTGGTMLQLDFGKQVSVDDIQDSLKKHDIEGADIVHFGEKNEGVVIKTTKAMTTEDRSALLETFFEDFGIDESAVQSFEQFGPSTGKLLQRNAVRAVLLAALFMLIYIIIRFKLKYGIAATVTTFHDIFITIALYGLFHFTINNPFIAAILTVVGYSINDTIVVFDRIRENIGFMKKEPLDSLVDLSVNQTLGRSLMTSLTTLIAILPLSFIGGEIIRQFTIPLIIGIVAGAASTIFVASPLFYDLSKKEFDSRGKYKGSSGESKKNKSNKNKLGNSNKGNGAVV